MTSNDGPDDDAMRVREYHARTRHGAPNRFARSSGYLDWATQPDPFLRYEGSPRVRLARIEPTPGPSLDALHEPGAVVPRPRDSRSIAQLLYDSLALSAFKSHGNARWSLRCNPSSGNLHPTEAYLVLPPVEGLWSQGSISHYAPEEHALEQVRVADEGGIAELMHEAGSDIALVALTSIHWREAWKYGERAFRYGQLDLGHAIAALGFAARALGWHVHPVRCDDGAVASTLGIDDDRGPEREWPEVLVAIATSASSSVANVTATFSELRLGARQGRAKPLSSDHAHWSIIDEVATASRRTLEVADRSPQPTRLAERFSRSVERSGESSARTLFRTRRSAIAMNARTHISRDEFIRIVRRIGAPGGAFGGLERAGDILVVFFVHRVEAIEPGVYALARSIDEVTRNRSRLDAAFEWSPCIDEGAEWGGLYLLQKGDTRRLAAALACGQDIAADGCFAVAMLAPIDEAMEACGTWAYRALHWEAGAIGQILYLESQRIDGVQGTGIGCFFDASVRDVLGIRGLPTESLSPVYMFTVGGAEHDPRVRSEPAYRDDDS